MKSHLNLNDWFARIISPPDGNVSLNGVNAENNSLQGAVILNHSGTTASWAAVLNGTFFGNYRTGLDISSKGNITLNHVEATADNIATNALIYGASLNNTRLPRR